MSRLDDHVAAVQNKLALSRFVTALAWASLLYAGLLLVSVLVDRIFLVHPPRPALWLYGGAALCAIGALVYAITTRPAPSEAAVAIDHKLGLKEKISTALYIRPNRDPFAQAAVLDAEQTARNVAVNLRQHFPTPIPRQFIATTALVIAAGIAFWAIEPMNLFGRAEKKKIADVQQQKVETAKKNVEKALTAVNAMPKTAENAEAIRLARSELAAMLEKPIADPAAANRTAVKALQDVNDAIKQQIKNSSKFAQAQNEMKMLKAMQTPAEGQGPVSDAHRAIAKGEFTEAMDELTKAVENFEKMDKEQQAKAAQQMQQLAQQLNKMANDPAQDQKLQQQLQQMGLNQQQAQQAQQLMQQAAQGDQQAQQQLQQMAQQQLQQMNNGQGPNPQQQQMMQQMMQQMQAQANAQQQAQQMGQAAQQMAQAMQQAAQQQAQQGQQPQQGQGQQNQQQQQMAQGMANMQQMLGQMQAQAQDAQQVAAAQQAAAAACQAAQDGMNGNNPGGQQGAGGGWANNQDIQGNGNPGQFQGQAGRAGPNQGGIGAGDRTYKEQAPYTVKQEVSQSQDDEKGRILASTYIKDNKPFKGQSTETLKQVAEAAQKEQTDEIEQERISRQAQKAVKEYFGSMEKEQ